MEDVPIRTGSGNGMGAVPMFAEGQMLDEFPPQGEPPAAEAVSGPLETRLQHSKWQARKAAFEELQQKLETEKSTDGWFEYFRAVQKESNAAVVESLLACLVVYLQVCAEPPSVESVLGGVFDKGLGCIKPKAVAAAQEVTALAVECGAASAVVDGIAARYAKVRGVKHKQALSNAMQKVFVEFGGGLFDMKACLPTLVAMLGDKDSQVRGSAKTMVRTLHAVHGETIIEVLGQKGVSSYTLAEITKDCESTEGLEQPTRAVRGKDVAVLPDASAPKQGAASGGDADDLIYDTATPEPVLKNIPKDYWTVVHDPKAKWAAKRALVEDTLLNLVSHPRLQNDDYHELTKSLKRQLADPNVAMVALTCKVILRLCRGLRTGYARDARILFPTLLDLQKEKKITVQEPLKEVLFTVYSLNILKIDDVVEDIQKAAGDKVLQVRSGTFNWMVRCVTSSRNPDEERRAVKTMKVFVPIALKVLDADPDSGVKAAAANVLGAYYRIVGEDGCTFMQSASQKVREKVVAASGKAGSAGPDAGARSAPSSPTLGGVKRPNPSRLGSPRAKTAKINKNSTAATHSRMAAGAGGAKKQAEAEPAGAPAALSAADAETALVELLGEAAVPTLLGPLTSKVMKERVEGMKALAAAVAPLDAAASASALEAVSASISHATPGWKDSCFMVLVEALRMLQALLEKVAAVPPRVIAAVVPAAEKLQDAKLKALVKDVLTRLCEGSSPHRVVGAVVGVLADAKSPKVHQEGLEWLSQVVTEFGAGSFDEKTVLQYALKCVDMPTPAVKAASCTLVGAVSRCMDAKAVIKFVQRAELRPDLVKKVEDEVEKAKALGAVVPKRTGKGRTASPGGADGLAGEARDIRPLLSAALLEKLSNSTWSTRCEALDELLRIVGRRMKPEVGPELIPALKQRLSDTNKNIIPPTCNVIAEMFVNMGPSCRAHASKLMGTVLSLLGDQKPTVRQGARKVLSAYDSVCGLDGLLPFLPKAMATEVPAARQELSEFLVTVFNRDAAKLPQSSLQPTVQHLVAFLQDRHPTTRKLAEEMLKPLIENVGYDFVMKHVGNLGAANQRALQPILDKNKFIGENGNGQATKPQAKRTLRTGSTPKEQPAVPPMENDENVMKPPPKPMAAKVGGAVLPKHVDPLCPPMDGSGHGFRLPEADLPAETPMLPRQVPVITAATSVEEATEHLAHPDASITIRAIEHIQAHRSRGGRVSMDDVVLKAMSRLTTICTDSLVPLDLPTAKSLVAFMMDVFTPPESMNCKTETMFFLIGALLDNLLTEKLHLMYRDEKSTETQKRESDETLRCLNSLMLKLLERSGRTQTFCALIKRLDLYNKLIYEESHRYVKYVELVAKCLLKLIRFVTTESSREAAGEQGLPSTDFTQLVAASHSFLIDNPPTNFKGKMELPLRTVKTLINELVKVKGESIRGCLLELNINDNALIAEFINMCLENAANQAEAEAQVDVRAQQQPAAVPAPEPATRGDEAGAAAMDPMVSKNMDEIFARVRKTETSREGVKELFLILREHPGLDPTPWMSECSVPFQGFLQRQLAALEAAEKAGGAPEAPAAPVYTSSSNMQAIRERMNRVRQERRGGDVA